MHCATSTISDHHKVLQRMEEESRFTGEETKVPEGQRVQARSEHMATNSKAKGATEHCLCAVPWVVPSC